jgi:serine/threonine protein kinase
MIRGTTLLSGKEICPGYRLGRLLGRGAYGHVWEATVEGRTMALKFLPVGDDTGSSQEIRSIQAVRQLRHPNLVRINELWCHRGYIVITMEMADSNLRDLLDAYQVEFGRPMRWEHVCPLLSQAASAIDFLNCRQHLVNGQRVAFQHADIKPSNMLVFGKTIKLSDFGLSSVITSPLKQRRPVGTPDYAAPEVMQGRLSAWTDQYALAITYCELRGGRLPFNPSAGSEPRPVADLTMLADVERPIIARALSTVPLDRWPSCGDMMSQLTNLRC